MASEIKNRKIFLIFFFIVLVICIITHFISAIFSYSPPLLIEQFSSFNKVISSYWMLIPILLLIALIIVYYSSSTIPEYIAATILLFSLLFYYAEFVNFLYVVTFWQFSFLANIPLNFQKVIISLLPEFDGISIFGFELLIFKLDVDIELSIIPLVILFSGIVIRIVIDKYIPNERLKEASREYWLFITTYVVLIAIFTDIYNISFFKIIIASILVVFLLAAGIFRIFGDIIKAFIGVIYLLITSLKILFMYIAFVTTRIVKFMRHLVRKIRYLYSKYIVEPIKRIFERIQTYISEKEENIKQILSDEKLDEED